MPACCTWKTYNGAHCPFRATCTGETYGPGRWLCDAHVECRDGKTGDLIVFKALNERKNAAKLREVETPAEASELVNRVDRMRLNAWQRSEEVGAGLYHEGWERGKARGVARDELHVHACAHMVQSLSRPDVKPVVVAQ